MSDGLNQVQLLGNLGADPELRATNSGQPVLKIRIATSKSYLDRNRVRQERTDWHSVVVWGNRATALGRILSKGSKIFVQGELRTSSWDDNDGKKQYRTEIVADKIVLCGGGRAQQGRSDADDRGGNYGGASDEWSRGDDEATDDDIPF